MPATSTILATTTVGAAGVVTLLGQVVPATRGPVEYYSVLGLLLAGFIVLWKHHLDTRKDHKEELKEKDTRYDKLVEDFQLHLTAKDETHAAERDELLDLSRESTQAVHEMASSMTEVAAAVRENSSSFYRAHNYDDSGEYDGR